ncbi:facilitated trehalose transporter Tret1 isoform X2 [Anabrus simplex]
METVTPMMPSSGGTSEGLKRPQYLAALAATLGAMAAGTVLAWTSPTLPELQAPNSSLPLSVEEGSWVGSLVAVGALAGAFPAGYCAETFGRKLTITALSAPFLLSWILIITAQNVAMLYIARLVAGIATGAISVTAPMYIGEIAEASVRGALGSFFQLMLTVGILYVYVFGAIASYVWLGIVCAAVPVALLVIFVWMPETPTFLLKKNRKADAERSLRFLRGANYNIQDELHILQLEVEEAAKNNASIKDLVSSRATRKALTVCLGLMVFQQLSGINAVIFYTVDIFEAAGSTLAPSVATIIVGVIQVVITYVASLLMDRAGRKILLLLSSGVETLCLGLLGLYFCLKDSGTDVSNLGWLPLVSLAFFVVVFSLGFGPIPWMMMGELFPASVKGAASGLAVTLNWVLVFTVTKSFQNLLTALGLHFTYWLFAIICAIAAVFVFFVVPETKGKSLQEIQDELNGPFISRRKPANSPA